MHDGTHLFWRVADSCVGVRLPRVQAPQLRWPYCLPVFSARFVFVMQPGMATLVCHRKTGSWLNDGWCLLGGERVSRASWRKGPQKPGVRRVGGCTADGLLLVAAPASFSVFGLVEISYRKNSFLHCEIKRCFDLSEDFLLR